jgi:hypothetical protein
MKLKLVVPDELIDHTFPVSVPQAIVESIGNVCTQNQKLLCTLKHLFVLKFSLQLTPH